jgi:hypothetical protein
LASDPRQQAKTDACLSYISSPICHETGAPNNAFEPTPLCGKQDRGDFAIWIWFARLPDLQVRRGSCPSRWADSIDLTSLCAPSVDA